MRFVRSLIPETLKDRINELPNVVTDNVPPPKVGVYLIEKHYTILILNEISIKVFF